MEERKKICQQRHPSPVHCPFKTSSLFPGVSLFPIGVGSGYDEEQLRILTGPAAANRIMKLQHFEDLSTMITLNSEFINKVCMGRSGIES